MLRTQGMAEGRRKARLWESLQYRAKNLMLLPTGSGCHQGSLKQDLVTVLTAQRWKGEGGMAPEGQKLAWWKGWARRKN